jgi:methylated-DNA-protein-cysteine methyltransferase-like protein
MQINAISAQSLLYQRICLMVQQIPAGRVATYGQIAALVGNCTARMVGYAMSSLDGTSDVPWQRVVNSQGKVSPRADSHSTEMQRLRLIEEGIAFDAQRRINLRYYRWGGPTLEWRLEHSFDPEASWHEG